MPRARWKDGEDRLGRLFGTVRRVLSGSGSRSGGRDDCQHPFLYLENKYKKRQSLWTLYRDTRDKAKREGRVPVVGIQEKGAKGTLLVIHERDLIFVALQAIKGNARYRAIARNLGLYATN